MRITSKCQVNDPDRNPRKGRLLPHTEVEVVLKGRWWKLRRATKAKKKSRGELLVEHLRVTAATST